MKKQLLLSFSGGMTSAFMTKKLLDTIDRNTYDVLVVFANTGKEREETLGFIHECDTWFDFNTVWLECVTNSVNGKGVFAKVVDYHTADRTGKTFEDSIKKHGISNVNQAICTRELKTYTINAYMRQIGWSKYYRAIGIRIDEIDRISPNHKKERIIYPLISMFPTKREDVNAFWLKQKFTLNLKSYQGNCDCCYKKSLRKLLTIAHETPELFEWWANMEEKYGEYVPETRKNNSKLKLPIHFFRNDLSARQILEMSKTFTDFSRDESKDIVMYKQLNLFDNELDISNGCTESCEPF
jgi:hypothetical protein